MSRIDLEYTGMLGEEAAALVEALDGTSVVALLLEGNAFGCSGAMLIARALERNSTLQLLKLSKNNIEFSGAVTLGGALEHNATLEDLNLSNNAIGAAGAEKLTASIELSTSLTHVGVSGNPGFKENWEAFQQRIEAVCEVSLARFLKHDFYQSRPCVFCFPVQVPTCPFCRGSFCNCPSLLCPFRILQRNKSPAGKKRAEQRRAELSKSCTVQ